MPTTATRAELVAEILAAETRAYAAERAGDGPAEFAERCELDALRGVLARWQGPATGADVHAIAGAALLVPARVAGGMVVQLPDGSAPAYIWRTAAGNAWAAELVDGTEVTRSALSPAAAVLAVVGQLLGWAPSTEPARPAALVDRRDGVTVHPIGPEELPTPAHAAAAHARGLADAAHTAAAARVESLRAQLLAALVDAERTRTAAAAAWVVEQTHI